MYWYEVRDGLIQEFGKWCAEVNCDVNIRNLVEYLGAMNYLKVGKIVSANKQDGITPFSRWEPYKEPLREGFLPYNTICHVKKKK